MEMYGNARNSLNKVLPSASSSHVQSCFKSLTHSSRGCYIVAGKKDRKKAGGGVTDKSGMIEIAMDRKLSQRRIRKKKKVKVVL